MNTSLLKSSIRAFNNNKSEERILDLKSLVYGFKLNIDIYRRSIKKFEKMIQSIYGKPEEKFN